MTAFQERKPAAASFPVVYRPPVTVRALLTFFGIVCAGASAWQIQAFFAGGEAKRLLGALLIGLPCLLAAAAMRRCVVVQEDGIRSINLFGSRSVPWQSVRRLDQTRTSFVIETDKGPISAGWLPRSQRDRLLRQVLEKAKLMARPGKLRWGLIASYIPRTQTITFRKTDSDSMPESPPTTVKDSSQHTDDRHH